LRRVVQHLKRRIGQSIVKVKEKGGHWNGQPVKGIPSNSAEDAKGKRKNHGEFG